MATDAIQAKNEPRNHAIAGAAAGIGEKVSGKFQDSRDFLHEVRVEMKQVTWPTREDVTSTTGVVIATVFFFAVFLAAVDWIVQRGVNYIFKIFGV